MIRLTDIDKFLIKTMLKDFFAKAADSGDMKAMKLGIGLWDNITSDDPLPEDFLDTEEQ